MKERSACYSVLSRLQSGRFFLKISKEIGKAWRKSLTRAKRTSLTRPTGVWGEREKILASRIFSVSLQSRSLFLASFQTFCLTARAYLNTQKYGLFRSLGLQLVRIISFFVVYWCSAFRWNHLKLISTNLFFLHRPSDTRQSLRGTILSS